MAIGEEAKLIMRDTTDILDYVIYWKAKSESGFFGELFHIVQNESGGSLRIPVGFIIGLLEPWTEYSPPYWKVLITVRDEIRYDIQSKSSYVCVKSAYASKTQYHIQKIKEFMKDVIRINPKLPTAIKDELIKEEFCCSPISIETITGKTKYEFSNVEFNLD